MQTKDAIAHFGSKAGIVRALGNRTKGAISQWGDVVPLAAALELEALTSGALAVDRGLYNTNGHVKQSSRAA